MDSFGYSTRRVLYTNPLQGVDVSIATELATNREVVLKRIATKEYSKMNDILHEAMTQRCLDHPNICKVYRVGVYPDGVFIVLEKLESDVVKVIRSQMATGVLFPEDTVWRFLREVVAALAFAQGKVPRHPGSFPPGRKAAKHPHRLPKHLQNLRLRER